MSNLGKYLALKVVVCGVIAVGKFVVSNKIVKREGNC